MAGVGQPGAHAMAEPVDQCVADLGVDRVETGRPGEVGVVDQFAQRPRDLGRPDRVGVDLGGVVKITQQVRGT